MLEGSQDYFSIPYFEETYYIVLDNGSTYHFVKVALRASHLGHMWSALLCCWGESPTVFGIGPDRHELSSPAIKKGHSHVSK